MHRPLAKALAQTGKQAVHWGLQRFGVDIHRLVWVNAVEDWRRQLLTGGRIAVLLDVGANKGQFGRGARLLGYDGRIVSFEPSSVAFAGLMHASAADSRWECREVAIGDVDGVARLNLSANGCSSSFLPLTDRALAGAPESRYVGTADVRVVPLDAIRNELFGTRDGLFLKVDVQGAELQVLRGARETLDQVRAIEAEVSVQPVYEGQPLISDIVAYLDDVGFDLLALEPAFRDHTTGTVLQLDAFFLSKARH